MNGRHAQRGLSLIEILVSLVIGLFVVAAVLFSYLGSGTTGKRQNTLGQMTEDVQIAFSTLARDLQLAASAEALNLMAGTGSVLTFVVPPLGDPVFGCDGPFVNPQAPYGAAACAGTPGPSSLQVSYVAGTVTTPMSSGGQPTDCLGAEVGTLPIGGITERYLSHRYYIAAGASNRPELYCASSMTNPGQPVAENVQDMRVWWGVAPTWDATNPASRQPVAYVSAAEVGTAWSTVVSARICLLMRSAEPVLTAEDSPAYTDCTGTPQVSTDGRAYRAFYTTVALRNRAGF